MKPSTQQEISAANLAAGKASDGQDAGKHVCQPNDKDHKQKGTGMSRKKQEEEKLKEQQRLVERAKSEAEAKVRAQEEIDAFRATNCIKLDYLHAFGAYTGGPYQDVRG